MNKISKLIKIIKDFIELRINAIVFSKKYEKLYTKIFLGNELPEKYKKIDKLLGNIFDEIHAKINFFEPNKEARKEHINFLNEKELYLSVKTLYKKIKIKMKIFSKKYEKTKK